MAIWQQYELSSRVDGEETQDPVSDLSWIQEGHKANYCHDNTKLSKVQPLSEKLYLMQPMTHEQLLIFSTGRVYHLNRYSPTKSITAFASGSEPADFPQ